MIQACAGSGGYASFQSEPTEYRRRVGSGIPNDETAQVHYASWRRGGVVAASRARAANGEGARIGYLGSSSPSLEPHFVEAFRQKLRELGHIEGENIAIEYRWAEGQDDRLPDLAAELVRLQPNVIVTTGTPGIIAAKQATKTIPIVFASSGNPVQAGLVAS